MGPAPARPTRVPEGEGSRSAPAARQTQQKQRNQWAQGPRRFRRSQVFALSISAAQAHSLRTRRIDRRARSRATTIARLAPAGGDGRDRPRYAVAAAWACATAPASATRRSWRRSRRRVSSAPPPTTRPHCSATFGSVTTCRSSCATAPSSMGGFGGSEMQRHTMLRKFHPEGRNPRCPRSSVLRRQTRARPRKVDGAALTECSYHSPSVPRSWPVGVMKELRTITSARHFAAPPADRPPDRLTVRKTGGPTDQRPTDQRRSPHRPTDRPPPG